MNNGSVSGLGVTRGTNPVAFAFSASATGSTRGTGTFTSGRNRLVLQTVSSLTVRDGVALLTGTGRWNNRSGYAVRLTATDGRPDGLSLRVTDSSGRVVFEAQRPVATGWIVARV